MKYEMPQIQFIAFPVRDVIMDSDENGLFVDVLEEEA